MNWLTISVPFALAYPIPPSENWNQPFSLHNPIWVCIVQESPCNVIRQEINIHISICIEVAHVINRCTGDTLLYICEIIEHLMTVLVEIYYMHAIRMIRQTVAHCCSIKLEIVGVGSVAHKLIDHAVAGAILTGDVAC